MGLDKPDDKFEATLEEKATAYMVEDFNRNPDGYTVAPYVNEYTTYDAFESGARWGREFGRREKQETIDAANERTIWALKERDAVTEDYMRLREDKKRLSAELAEATLALNEGEWNRIYELNRQLAEAKREIEAYRKAKAENDERFMLERDAALATLEQTQKALSSSEADLRKTLAEVERLKAQRDSLTEDCSKELKEKKALHSVGEKMAKALEPEHKMEFGGHKLACDCQRCEALEAWEKVK